STSNSRVKEWKKLNTKKGRKKQNKYILDGLHLVKEALKANKKVEELLITSKFEHLNEIEIPDETKVIMISEEVSKSISETQTRSEEHTSELQSRFDLVCRLLLDKK